MDLPHPGSSVFGSCSRLLSVQKEFLELPEICSHGNGQHLHIRSGAQSFRQRQIDSENAIHIFLELGRRGSAQEHAGIAVLKSVVQHFPGNGTMRLGGIAFTLKSSRTRGQLFGRDTSMALDSVA